MKKLSLLLLLVMLTLVCQAKKKKQTEPLLKYTDEQIAAANDSILKEGNLLYLYEKLAWVGGDIMAEAPDSLNFRNYLVYHKGKMGNEDFEVTILLLNEISECMLQLSFIPTAEEPSVYNYEKRKLTEYELDLLITKSKIMDAIIKGNYDVGYPDEYGLNFILLPDGTNYKMYVITGYRGTKRVIPFGNDYLFYATAEGEITSWKKMHSILIAMDLDAVKGIMSTTHSHRPEEPFITATDICTFKLYGSLYDQERFTVVSTALKRAFIYYLYNERIETKSF